MRVQQISWLAAVFSLSVFVLSSVAEETTELSDDFNAEDRARFELLKLSDMTGKSLQFELIINKTNKVNIEPKVQHVLSNLTANMTELKDELILLREEINACGNVSNIHKCKAWKEVFNCCISNIDTELYAIKSLMDIIVARAKLIKDFRYVLRLKPIDEALLKKALGELNFAKRQLAGGVSSECRVLMQKVPDALMKFGKTLVLARNFIQMQINKFEKPKGILGKLDSWLQ